MSKKRKYAIRTPLTVKGGIRAQQANFGVSRVWWSRRWTEMMEDFRIGARLGRGRNYAISGQVSDLTVGPGLTEARVQGAAPEPYVCVIKFRVVTDEAREHILRGLRQSPMLLARLLSGEMPFEIEGLFREVGMPFFPQRTDDVWSHCSCPDYANPCKHLAAVYYLLGESFARNPLLLLTLRGVPVALPGQAGAVSPSPPSVPSRSRDGGAARLTPAAVYGVSRPAPAAFPGLPSGGALSAEAPDAPLLARLGPLPFWRGQERFLDTLTHLYARAAPRGRVVQTGDVLDLRREEEKIVIKGGNLKLSNRRLRVDPSF
jgi:uncharacterized Zn finger protein